MFTNFQLVFVIYCFICKFVRLGIYFEEVHLIWNVDDIMSSRVRGCSGGKCISLARLSKFIYGVQSRGPSNQSVSSRTSGHKRCRVTKNIVEWKNAYH